MAAQPFSRVPAANASTAAQRSAEIVQRATERLQASGYPALKRLTCTFHEGVLVLHGSLPSFYLKQVAQTLMVGIDGVIEVLNRAEVGSESDE